MHLNAAKLQAIKPVAHLKRVVRLTAFGRV